MRNKIKFRAYTPRKLCAYYGAVIYLRILTSNEIRTPVFK